MTWHITLKFVVVFNNIHIYVSPVSVHLFPIKIHIYYRYNFENEEETSIKAQGRWHDGHPVLTNYTFKIIVVAVDIHLYNLYSCL